MSALTIGYYMSNMSLAGCALSVVCGYVDMLTSYVHTCVTVHVLSHHSLRGVKV